MNVSVAYIIVNKFASTLLGPTNVAASSATA